MANGEPVNERPLLPSLHRTDAVGVGHWSSDLIRQLITVFQQYGFRINQSVTEDALAAELTGYVENAPGPTVTDLNDVTGGAFRVIATGPSTGNVPPGTTGWGVVLHVARVTNRRIQVHLLDNATSDVPDIHIRVEGSGGFGSWRRVDFMSPTVLDGTVNLNNLDDPGIYWLTSAPTNGPISAVNLIVRVIRWGLDTPRTRQVVYRATTAANTWTRQRNNAGDWGSWYAYNLTEVT